MAAAVRGTEHTKTDQELAINIKKATNVEEISPKRKHVRACIVYTWDHRSSAAFWSGIKVQPILADEVQTFKALITIHKVLQEGHPSALKEAMANRAWIDSLNRGMGGGGEGMRGYAPLIREYVYYLLAKLSFHHQHPEFNGTFEYEEYLSLKAINDPNEGYETISDLMVLQDKIEQFQKLIFSHFRNVGNNECRIAALVPLVQESYGIYKFITSMLRAMHSTTGDDEALEPLRERYNAQHYRLRVKALEGELSHIQNSLGQQMNSKDDQIRALQEQVNTWRTKYEALAKLYSQLRHEHLDLLQKFKAVQLKAASAQEAIDRREKLEREIKTKNLELADMIRERDRALHDKDRATGSSKDEVEKLKRELRLAQDKADNLERSKGNELSTMLAKYNREMADLEEALRNKTRQLEDAQMNLRDGSSDLEQLLRDKEEELEVYKAGMDQTLIELNELKMNQGDTDHALDGQIDALIMSNLDKINDIIDSVLQAGVARVDDALYELDSSMQAGNQNASPSYVLSQIEKASASAMEFATSFNNFIADGPNATHADLIKAINVFSGAIADVCSNTKGLTRLATDDKKTDSLMNGTRQPAISAVQFLRGLQSFRLEGMDPLQKTDVVINSNNDVQMNLQKLNKLVESFAPGFGKLANKKGDLGDLVDQELSKAADAIAAAAARLAKLKNKPRDGYSTYELKVNDSILDAATAITNAITQLIQAATVTQQEIVQAGRGSTSRTAFYKKNNRWTEGLISAAKAVASSTNTLIETADGVISGRNSPEQLIVASNDVAASTAQLVAASRVKAGFMSKSQEKLEQASKAVGAACRALVRQVQSLIKERSQEEDQVDYSKLGAHEFKVREMEQQVEILQLENALASARHRLGEMRKISYQEE
ncbi:hypothetical protein FPRO03_10788 [Fusarium proliferatum]|uniref:Endocytosis protein end4 n=1 Tax=Gibberella intermedia TaxID=948311 RepID=A0A365N1W4_GIBIN|nr:hypothetical protein FPRO03_10788 [Fusarium proliferatum]RBA14780.1 hypothetical protein FPRO05_13325 [Fusarium proliferatum]